MNALAWPGCDDGARRHPDAALRSEPVVLRGGRRVTLRAVRPEDAAAEQRFITTLSPRSRLFRFHGAVNLLPATVLRSMTQVDQRQHVALVAEAGTDDGALLLVADARYVVDAGDPVAADFAIAVADDWQRQGLARALLQRLAAHARRHGVLRLHGSVMTANEPMLALMRRLGARLRADPGDASTLTALLPA